MSVFGRLVITWVLFCLGLRGFYIFNVEGIFRIRSLLGFLAGFGIINRILVLFFGRG